MLTAADGCGPLATIGDETMRSMKSWRYLLAGLVSLGLLLCTAGQARAEPFWKPQGSKAGPWMFNLKLGGALGAYAYSGYYGGGYFGYYRGADAFVLQTEAGYAITRDRNGYLVLPLTFQLAPGFSTIMVPFGFQYDIPMPLPGLYLTPRISAGFAASVFAGYYGYAGGYYSATTLSGLLIPEFGVKYVLKGRLNFGADLFGLPIFFNGNGAVVQYRVLLYAGINI
jgi:hypothetical protein